MWPSFQVETCTCSCCRASMACALSLHDMKYRRVQYAPSSHQRRQATRQALRQYALVRGICQNGQHFSTTQEILAANMWTNGNTANLTGMPCCTKLCCILFGCLRTSSALTIMRRWGRRQEEQGTAVRRRARAGAQEGAVRPLRLAAGLQLAVPLHHPGMPSAAPVLRNLHCRTAPRKCAGLCAWRQFMEAAFHACAVNQADAALLTWVELRRRHALGIQISMTRSISVSLVLTPCVMPCRSTTSASQPCAARRTAGSRRCRSPAKTWPCCPRHAAPVRY